MNEKRWQRSCLVVLAVLTAGCQDRAIAPAEKKKADPARHVKEPAGIPARETGGIDPSVVTAWEDAGANFDWLVTADVAMGLPPHRPAGPNAIPAFNCIGRAWGPFKDLPAPQVPFGLVLGTEITDADVASLPRFKYLRALDLHCPRLTNAAAQSIAQLDQLEKLALWRVGTGSLGWNAAALQEVEDNNLFSDKGLADLATIKCLVTLDLHGSPIGNAGLKALADFPRLQTLDLSETLVRDVGIRELTGLKQLKRLALKRTMVSDSGLAALAALTQLQVLDVSESRVTDAGVRELRMKLPKLEVIALGLTVAPLLNAGEQEMAAVKILQQAGADVWRDKSAPGQPVLGVEFFLAKITDEHLKQLKYLKRLELLVIHATPVTALGLMEIGDLQSVQVLTLAEVRLTDGGLKELKALKNLKELHLYNNPITNGGLRELNGFTKLRWLDLSGTLVTDAGIKELKGLSSLVRLDLKKTYVTDAGVAELRKSLPICNIYHERK